MLHAFNLKNVRRVLAQAAPDEHVNEKNEDGITSMVFSPLAFMPLASVMTVLGAVIGPRFAAAVHGRQPTAYDVQLWPRGLQAIAWNGDADSRCEPDLMVRLTFTEGRPLVLLGEMKWDWLITAEHLAEEIGRQVSAVNFQDPRADQLVFAITKFKVQRPLPGVELRTWVDVQRHAYLLAQQSPRTPEGRWGALVGAFLNKAKQASFQGFHEGMLPDIPREGAIFWAETDRKHAPLLDLSGLETIPDAGSIFWRDEP